MTSVLEELLEARIPESYEAAAFLQHEMLKEMLGRLHFMTLKPQTILDVGSATGNNSLALKDHYPDATIIAVDASLKMIEYAKQRSDRIKWLCAPLTSLPVLDHSIDLIIANNAIPWCDDVQKLLQEWRRVLRPNGLLMLTSLGPDTLRELHDLPLAFPHLMDMHTVGDLLMQAGFSNPVLDVDYVTLTYEDQKKLWHELEVTGMIAGNVDSLQENNDSLTYEIIFGHAFGSDVKANHTGEIRIPVSHIRKKI